MVEPFRLYVNDEVLKKLGREFPGRAAAVVQKAAQDCQADIVDNFSSQSPSDPGLPPGVDTGNLKNTTVAEPGVDPLTWLVKIGAKYGFWLEFGTENEEGGTLMAPRPFVVPAVERARERMPDELKKVVEP
jgi:hypothetical protein